ncbi:MAG TPA: amidohydrolase family protein [Acidobacteriaceae bacterium]|nr:amidohydrolase family protein [Acidobacteriaceae bacterium]
MVSQLVPETLPRDLQPIVDAHHHYWDLSLRRHPWLDGVNLVPHRYGDYRAICKSFMPNDYDRAAGHHRIVGNVYMEAEWDPADPTGETRWVHGLRALTGRPHAMIAQARLDADDAGEVLAAQAGFPLVRGVRHKPKSFASAAEWTSSHRLPGSMMCPKFRQGYVQLASNNLHFELQTPHWHLPDAVDLAASFPETLIVINHTGLPTERDRDGIAAWRRSMEKIAGQPNVRLKISGIGVPGTDWTASSQREVVLAAIKIFGVDRCMFASNYPVDGLLRSLEGIFDDFLKITADFSRQDRDSLFRRNALELYRLDLPTNQKDKWEETIS